MNIESTTVKELIPRFIRDRADVLGSFLEEYYNFVNAKPGPSYYINRLVEEHDLDEVVDPLFLDMIGKELAGSAPESPYVLKAFLLKRIVEYYEIKGSNEAAKYFFRIFFNVDIDLFEPWERVFIPSSGKWVSDILLRVTDVAGDLVGQKVTSSGDASAIIVDVVEREHGAITIQECRLVRSSIREQFIPGEIITAENGATATVYRSLTSITIENGGTGYKVGDLVYVPYIGDKMTFKAIVDRVEMNSGAIEKVSIVEFGTGTFTLNDEVVFQDFQINPMISPLVYNELALLIGESNLEYILYNDNSTIDILSENGTGAILRLNFGSVVQTRGYYADEKGHLSAFSVLQDSIYHQKFSYEIYGAPIPLSVFKESYASFIEPGGINTFARLTIEASSDNALAVDFTSDRIAPELADVDEEITCDETVFAFTQNYFLETYILEDYVSA